MHKTDVLGVAYPSWATGRYAPEAEAKNGSKPKETSTCKKGSGGWKEMNERRLGPPLVGIC